MCKKIKLREGEYLDGSISRKTPLDFIKEKIPTTRIELEINNLIAGYDPGRKDTEEKLAELIS